MRKGLKVLSTSLLLSTLFVAGCSCSKEDPANVSKVENSGDSVLKKEENSIGEYTIDNIYNSLIKDDAGNKVIANKLVEFVANEVLEMNKENSVWKERYDDLVEEKLEELADSGNYLVKNKFSEKYMVESLKYDGYSISCPVDVVYGTVDDLSCDYTDYVEQNIKVDVLSKLLKQKYLQDVALKDRAKVLTDKKIRDVEYFTVSSSLDDSYEDLSIRDFMRELRDRIANKEVIDFATIEEELKQKLKDIIKVEYDKIGTSEDYTQAIAAKYTNNFTQNASKGYEDKLKTVDKEEYNFSKLISSDSDKASIVSEAITSSILNIKDPSDKAFARRVIKITDKDNVDNYYLVNVNAGVTVDEKDILLSETADASKYTYSIVRFKVINSDTTDENDLYRAVSLLAEESTLASNALNHYVKEKKDAIKVYDDEVKTYLESLYPDVFAE